MPRISEFRGIEIYRYHTEHLPPHSHALYAEFEAQIEIRNQSIIEGFLPPRIRRLVVTWARIHTAPEFLAEARSLAAAG